MPSHDHFCLTRLILIDSYRPGFKIEVKLDGHTSFNGANGTGKTSLLRLIPLFYGESPNKLVQAGGVTKSFIDHYLTRTTSYIIFEYFRRGIPCMAVLHSSTSRDQVCYRFIDQPFDLSRFQDDQGELVAGADMHRHITKRREICTEQITVLADYRSVIQNTVTKKDLRNLPGRFAFVGAGGRLGHIEKIATGMFSRMTNFRDLRRMIVSCITDSGNSIRLETNKAALASWVSEYRAYTAVMGHAHRMDSLNEASLRHASAVSELSRVHTQVIRLGRLYEAEIQAHDDELGCITQEMTLLSDQTNVRLLDLGEALGVAQGEAKNLGDGIATLESRHTAYADEKIEGLAALVNNIPNLETRLRTVQTRHDTLLGELSKIETQYSQLKSDRTAQFTQYQSDQVAMKDPIHAQAEREKGALRDRFKHEWSLQSEAFEKESNALIEARSPIQERIGALKTIVQSPQPGETYVLALEEAVQALDQAKDDLQAAQQAYADSEGVYAREAEVFNDVEVNIHQLTVRREEYEQKKESLLALTNATPGTLLHFLREHRPSWTEDVARVVPESLLLRDDLSPVLVEEAVHSLYSIGLDLTVIDSPRVADEAALQAQIELAGRTIARVTEELKVRRTDLEQQSKRLADAKDNTNLTQAAKVTADSRKNTCFAAKESARRNLEQDRRHVLSQANQELSEKQTWLAKNKTAVDSITISRKDAQLAHEQALIQAQTTVDSRTREALEQIDRRIDLAKSQCDQDLANFARELLAALQAGGVDTQSLELLKAEKNTLTKDLELAHASIAKVEGWRIWLQDEWTKCEPMKLALGEANRKLVGLTSEINQVRANRTRQQQVLDARKTTTQGARNKAAEFLSFVGKRRAQLAPWPADEARELGDTGPVPSLDTLGAEIDRLTRDLNAIRTQAQAAVDELLRVMSERANTSPFTYYDKQRLALGPDQGSRSPLVWVAPLQGWFEVEHANVRSLLVSQASTFSQGIHDFHERLEKFNRQVGTFSKDLQGKMDASVQFRAISRIGVRLDTSFDTLDGWDKIQKLDEAFMGWARSQANALPPDTFADAVEQVNGYLQGRHTVEVQLDDLLSIAIDIDEIGQPRKTVKDEAQLKDASSNGLSYLILCVIFVGLINKIRRGEPVRLVWALDELRDLDLGNVEALLKLLDANDISLVSAFPDADPDILRYFKNRYAILDGRKVASVSLPGEVAHV